MALPSRWLQDDAINLQLREVNAIPSMLNDNQERRLFAGLCLFRADKRIKAQLQQDLTTLKRFTPFHICFSSLLFAIEDDPAAYPFSLSEREFSYYANTIFGGKLGDIEGIYHPPGFYVALVQDIVSLVVAPVIGALAVAALPEATSASALSLPALATASGRAAIGGAMGSVVSHLMPGGSWDAGRKNRLWPRYEVDFKRRSLK